MKEATRALALVIIPIVILAIMPRVPLSLLTSSYFYHEDDAHHFNRTVEMAKRGDLNPHYFNKPSLHFYLRLPIVAGSVALEKARGRVGSVHEVRTRDPYGLAGYAYTVSHPTILAINRAFSAALSVGIIIVAATVAFHFRVGRVGIFLAGVITAFSPEFLSNSHIIGVDIVMAFFCVLCTATAMSSTRSYSRWKLIMSGLFAGLAGASKYNALPIAFVPLVAWYLKDRSLRGFVMCGVAPLLGFLVGCPYALISFAEFWSGLSYEVWHYSVAGHEGHSAQPGIEQALFYGKWLITDGIGVGGSLLAALGLLTLLAHRTPQGSVFLTFPVLYFALMVAQKANFTRNMVPVVPYVAILAGLGFSQLLAFLARGDAVKSRGRTITIALLTVGVSVATLVPLIKRSGDIIRAAAAFDSRDALADWTRTIRPLDADLAIAGPLQVPPSLFKISGVDAFDPTKQSAASLAQAGFEFIAVPAHLAASLRAEFLSNVLSISGIEEEQRVPRSPAIKIFKVDDSLLAKAAELSPATIDLLIDNESEALPCVNAREGHCWIQNKITTVLLHRATTGAQKSARLEIMSPWSDQRVSITTPDGRVITALTLKDPGVWTPATLSLPANSSKLLLSVSQVHSPHSRLVGGDKRRLGVALRIAS